jgi:hypothetical protein
MKITLLLIFIASIFLISCSEEETTEPYQELEFYSLVTEKDTIAPGQDTKVTANASGSNLSYFWSASVGDILGSGKEITYASSPCHVGTNTITCKIENARNQSETKSIQIVVLE